MIPACPSLMCFYNTWVVLKELTLQKFVSVSDVSCLRSDWFCRLTWQRVDTYVRRVWKCVCLWPEFDFPEMTPRGWQDIKIQLLLLPFFLLHPGMALPSRLCGETGSRPTSCSSLTSSSWSSAGSSSSDSWGFTPFWCCGAWPRGRQLPASASPTWNTWMKITTPLTKAFAETRTISCAHVAVASGKVCMPPTLRWMDQWHRHLDCDHDDHESWRWCRFVWCMCKLCSLVCVRCTAMNKSVSKVQVKSWEWKEGFGVKYGRKGSVYVILLYS